MARRSQAVRANIVGLEDLQADLRRFAGQLDDLTVAYSKVSEMLRDRSRAAAPSSISQAIQRSANPKGASVQVIHRPPRALGVVMGANRRFGWYEAPQFRESSGKQFEKWVGNQWSPGSDSGKPYYIGDAINDSIDDAIELLADEVMHLARFAFPDMGLGSIIP